MPEKSFCFAVLPPSGPAFNEICQHNGPQTAAAAARRGEARIRSGDQELEELKTQKCNHKNDTKTWRSPAEAEDDAESWVVERAARQGRNIDAYRDDRSDDNGQRTTDTGQGTADSGPKTVDSGQPNRSTLVRALRINFLIFHMRALGES